jgi:hypothetical protein
LSLLPARNCGVERKRGCDRRLRRRAVAGVLLCAGSLGAAAQQGDWLSQVGYPGALQTPTSLMPQAGSLGFGISRTLPYSTLHLSLQPFDWLSFSGRYTEISDREYLASPGSAFIDKSFDVAVRLVEARAWMPSLTVGFVDLGGTGLFSSEYIVASQRIFDFYASVGMGWGRMGSAADFENPLSVVSDRFDTRPGFRFGEEQGGSVGYERWFRGRDVALFGSLMWKPSFLPNWSLLVEVDGNDYSQDRAGRPIDAPSRVNGGISYTLGDTLTIGASYLRGNTVAFEIGIHPLIGTDAALRGKRYLPVLSREVHPGYRAPLPADMSARLERFYDVLRFNGFFLHAIDVDENAGVLTLWQSNAVTDEPLYVLQFIGRQAINHVPESIQTVRVVSVAGGAEAMRAEAPRWLLEAEGAGRATQEELLLLTAFGPGQGWAMDDARYPGLLNYPTFSYGISPSIRSNIGGPGFFVGQLQLKPYLTTQLTRSFSVTTSLGVNLADDFDRLIQPAAGELPRVRSDLELYQSSGGAVYLEEMEANFLFPLASQWYGRLSAGIFEEMYGGVGTELLYRPFGSRWAASINANYVRKRDYDQRFEFLDYEVATGHLNLYYRAPIAGIVVEASAGRYLARDVGVSLDLSRTFRNGARFGVFATKTDASSAEFGEGSFDKGFYVYFPLSTVNKGLPGDGLFLNYRFLTRDGGQKVNDGRSLYGVYGRYDAGAVHGR